MNEKEQLIQLAIQLTAAEQYMEAIQALRKAYKVSPYDPEITAQLHRTRTALLDKSHQLLNRNRFSEPHKRLAVWLMQFPKDAPAQALYDRIPELAKDYRLSLRSLAQQRIRIKDYQGAQMLFQNWLQQFPEDVKAQSDLGQIERFVVARAARPTPRETTEAEALVLKTMEIPAIDVNATATSEVTSVDSEASQS